MNLREEILGIQDCGEKTIKVKQWGNRKVLVKAFTAGARYDLLSQCSIEIDGKPEIDRKKLLFLTIIETAYDPATGEKIFGIADVEALAAKNYGAIEQLGTVANELSGIGPDSQEEAEKN